MSLTKHNRTISRPYTVISLKLWVNLLLTRVKAFGDGGGTDHVALAQAADYTRVQRLEPHSALHHTASSSAFLLHAPHWHITYTRHPAAHTHTHTRLTALFPALPRWAGTRKVKPIWILLKQETVSGSGTSWAICNLAPCSRQTTTSAPHHSVFYRPDALPAAQPTVSKHWRNDIPLLLLLILLKFVIANYTKTKCD